jgi:sigma-B regulation protein RsbU (phosphoserine phosphatase)
VSRISRARQRSASAAGPGRDKPAQGEGWRVPRWFWPAPWRRPLPGGGGISLEPEGPVQRGVRGDRAAGLLLALAVTAVAAAQYAAGGPDTTLAWLAIAPLLGSLVLPPRLTALLAGWTVLLGLGLALSGADPAGHLVSRLAVLVLLAAFAVANSVLRAAAQRRLGQARAVARVAQSVLLREVPQTVAAARLASRYLSASAEAQVGGDLLEVVAGPRPRWLVGDTKGNGLPAVRLASVAATSFRDACARPGLSLAEVARAVDLSVTRAAGAEDFVTAVFAELDPRGWVQLVLCGHPPPLRLRAGGELEPLAPAAFATPLGLHPDLHLSTFSVNDGDRLLFFTDGLLEARDRAGRFFSLEEHLPTLRRPGLQSAVDELLDQVRAHTRYRLEDDVAVLLVELTLTSPASGPGNAGQPGHGDAAAHPDDQPAQPLPTGADGRHYLEHPVATAARTRIPADQPGDRDSGTGHRERAGLRTEEDTRQGRTGPARRA